MTFHLQPPYTYAQLKLWFLDNKSRLPISVDTEHFIVFDLHKCIETYICAVDEDIKQNGSPTRNAKNYKDRMVTIYLALQNPDNHNNPLQRIEPNNRI